MPKPDPSLLNPAIYPFRCEIESRYTDLDTNAHINNVAIVEIMQEARVKFHHASSFGKAVSGLSSMAASFSVEYLGQSFHPDPLTVHVGALAVGRTSHTLAQLMLQDDGVVAYAQAVIVCTQDNRPTENPQLFKDAIKDWMLTP